MTSGVMITDFYNQQSEIINQQFSGSVPEMPHAGEEHSEPETVGGGDDFRIALRAAGLNDGGSSGAGDFFDAVGEGKKRVGGGDCAVQRELRFHSADFGRIDAGHLAGADPHGLSI